MIPPKHVAIIMDGNGRWGIKKKNSRNYGHTHGVKTVESIIKESISAKIKFLTLYTFSTENWKRPKKEVNFLIKLLENYIQRELKILIKKKYKNKNYWKYQQISKIFKRKIKKS